MEAGAPPPEIEATDVPEELPSADVGDMVGPEPPVATELTREQRRFGRYDRDTDGNNLLTFEEWAATTVDRFEYADVDGNDWLTPEEFARTAPPRPKPKAKCRC
mgnify:CR=1 FL=1